MKKTRLFAATAITLAALGALGTTPAAAQSSVTLFGVMDLGLRNVKSGSVGSLTSEANGNNASTRFGFRGVEDLGGGLSASFWLESSIFADTGAAGATVPPTFFDRISTVGLASASWGDVRLGRDYTPAFLAMAGNDPFGAVGLGGTANLISQSASRAISNAFGSPATNTSTTARTNNGVHYRTPATLGGVYAHLTFSLDEGQANSANGGSKTSGGRLGYGSGPFDVSYSTLTTRNTLVAGESFKDSVLAGSYDFGVVKLRLIQRTVKFMSDKQTTTWLAATAPVGNSLLKIALSRADQSGATAALSANDATMLALGYVYNLSTRTALYVHGARIANKGQAFFALPGGPATTAANFGGQTSTGYEAGIRHIF